MDHGATLDGQTDDTAALRAAFEAAGGEGAVVVPPGGELRVTEPVVFDLGGASGFQLRCRSPIAPDAGVGDALTIQKGQPRRVDFWVRGGGRDADYTRPDPDGADQALVLRLVRGGRYRILGGGYGGRILRVVDRDDNDAYKTSKLRIEELATRWYDGDFCGQSFYVDGKSAIGKLGLVHDFWSAYGPVVDGGYDFGIGHIAGGWQNTGLSLRNTGNLTIGTFAVGDESHSVALLSLSDCRGIHVKRAFCLRARTGVSVTGSANVSIGDLYTVANEGAGLAVRDTERLRVAHTSSRDTVAERHEGAEQVSVDLFTAYADDAEAALDVTDSTDLTVRGSVEQGIAVDGASDAVHLDGVRAPLVSVPADNDVRVEGGDVGYFEGTPRKRNGLGREESAAETPTADDWQVGDVVQFVDTGDGSGDGLYLRVHDGWERLDGRVQRIPFWPP